MIDPDLKKGVDALGGFFTQFGTLDDVYVRVFMEVLLEELFGIDSDVVGEYEEVEEYGADGYD